MPRKTLAYMTSWFQTASGAWHWPSILTALGWLIGSLVTGAFVLANIRANRIERVRSALEAKAASIEASKQAATDRDEIANAREKAEAATARAEAATAKATALEAAQSPRHLSDMQKSQIRTAVGLVMGRPRITIGYRGDDPEAANFTNELNNFFISLGFDSQWTQMLATILPNGITLNTSYSDQALVQSIGGGLDAASLLTRACPVNMGPSQSPNTTTLVFIGSKP